MLAIHIGVSILASSRLKQAILSELASWAKYGLGDDFVEQHWGEILKQRGGYAALGETLTQWAADRQQPFVLLIDEIDSLIGDTLIAVLRQLRAGYSKRPEFFP